MSDNFHHYNAIFSVSKLRGNYMNLNSHISRLHKITIEFVWGSRNCYTQKKIKFWWWWKMSDTTFGRCCFLVLVYVRVRSIHSVQAVLQKVWNLWLFDVFCSNDVWCSLFLHGLESIAANLIQFITRIENFNMNQGLERFTP